MKQNKELKFQPPHNSKGIAKPILAAGAKIKYCKPNLFQKLMYRIGLMKDPIYNGKKIDRYLLDEVGTWR